MKKNVGSQIVGAQMTTAADGTNFSGAVTVYFTLDNGTQTIGSVGSGAATSKGNGYYTYAPTAGETNGDLCAYTFVGTGAITATVQYSTQAATSAADIQNRLPAALTANGNIKASAQEILTTTLTETSAGYLSAGFKKFFDVAVPQLTVATSPAGIASAVWTDAVPGDFTVATSIGLSLKTTAAPGSANGLIIDGSNAGTVTFADGLVISRTTANQPGLQVSGNGNANGASFFSGSGSTGNAIGATALSLNGKGASIQGAGTGSGLTLIGGVTSGNGMDTSGGGTGAGMVISSGSGTSGNALNLFANSINGIGFNIAGSGTGDAIRLSPGPSGIGLNASTINGGITGNIVGNLSGSVGSVTNVAAIATAVWQDLTAGSDFATTGSIGKALTTGGSSPTAAQIATAVWQDTVGTDFTTVGSIGQNLKTSGNTPGSASGHGLVGSNVGTCTGVAGNLTGSVGSIGVAGMVALATQIWEDLLTGGDFATAGSIGKLFNDKINGTNTLDTITTAVNAVSGSVLAGMESSATLISDIANGVWTDAAPGDFTASGSIGLSLKTTGAPGATSGLALVGSNMGTATSVTGAVGSVTGNVGGSVASVTGAVGSVSGNVAGNVSGSVASVTGAVGSVTSPVTVASGTVTTVSGNVNGNVNGSVGSVSGAVGSITTVANIATAVWTDAVGTDFTAANSIGKDLKTGAVPGGTGGIALVGSNVGSATSVTGSVGSVASPVSVATGTITTVTGNVNGSVGSVIGNVNGSVSSVTGAVGSVTGSVGSVAGAVASVTAPVTVGTNNDKLGYSLNVTPPTAAQIATAVWTDTTGSDFTTINSIGKSLGGAFTALGTSIFTAGALQYAPVGTGTGGGGGGASAAEIAAAVWQDTSDFSTPGSIGMDLKIGHNPGAAGGIALVGSNMGTVASVTGNLGGNVNGSVNSVVNPTSIAVATRTEMDSNSVGLASAAAQASSAAASASSAALAATAGAANTNNLPSMIETTGTPSYNRFKASTLERAPGGVINVTGGGALLATVPQAFYTPDRFTEITQGELKTLEFVVTTEGVFSSSSFSDITITVQDPAGNRVIYDNTKVNRITESTNLQAMSVTMSTADTNGLIPGVMKIQIDMDNQIAHCDAAVKIVSSL
jgi:hypothetical protein